MPFPYQTKTVMAGQREAAHRAAKRVPATHDLDVGRCSWMAGIASLRSADPAMTDFGWENLWTVS